MRSSVRSKVDVLDMKHFETILFPQDMIQDIYNLHWNIIHTTTGVT